VWYTYDAVGRAKSVNNGVSALDYVYDALGRVQTLYSKPHLTQTPYGSRTASIWLTRLRRSSILGAAKSRMGYEAANQPREQR